MKILIVGSGGREHALAWKAKQSPKVTHVFVAPGNAGTALEAGIHNVDIQADDIAGLLNFAQARSIDLTIVGPEVPLVMGIVDQFQAAGLACFGPTAKAAQLEGSKSFCKDFMARHASLPPPTKPLPIPNRPLPTFVARARRSWSKPTAWLPGKASSLPRPKNKRSIRYGICYPATVSAKPGIEWWSRSF